MNQKIIIASGPVIVEEGKVLLDKQGKDDFWKFCGGRINENEDLRETAKRRAKEELGFDIEFLNNKPFLMHVSKRDSEKVLDVILVHYLARRKGDIEQGSDVSEWQWFDINNLPDDAGPNVKPALKHFNFI